MVVFPTLRAPRNIRGKKDVVFVSNQGQKHTEFVTNQWQDNVGLHVFRLYHRSRATEKIHLLY